MGIKSTIETIKLYACTSCNSYVDCHSVCDPWKVIRLSRSVAETVKRVSFTMPLYPSFFCIWEFPLGHTAIQNKGYIFQLQSHQDRIGGLSSGQWDMLEIVMWEISESCLEKHWHAGCFLGSATTLLLPSCCWKLESDSWNYLIDHKNKGHTLKMEEGKSERRWDLEWSMELLYQTWIFYLQNFT